MFRSLFFAAVLAALCAGLVNSAIQFYRVTPLILAAETYEGAGHDHGAADATHSHDQAAAPHSHGEAKWAPQGGFARTFYTVLANLLVAASFALILGAISIFSGLPITSANGALWGLAAFLAVSLAPAYGMPPELPGMPAAEVFPRQVWWFGTVFATGAAILLLVKTRAAWALALSSILVATPHIVGAPRPPEGLSAVPAHLASSFASASLGTAAIMWLVLGLSFGLFNEFFARARVSRLSPALG